MHILSAGLSRSYANFSQIVRDVMAGLKPMTYAQWQDKYLPKDYDATRKAKRHAAAQERATRSGWHIYYLEDGAQREYPLVSQTEEELERRLSYVRNNMPNVTNIEVKKL